VTILHEIYMQFCMRLRWDLWNTCWSETSLWTKVTEESETYTLFSV